MGTNVDGLILQLHAWDAAHHHGHMGDPTRPVGNGVMLWFEVDDFDAAVARARELQARVVLDVHVNPSTLVGTRARVPHLRRRRRHHPLRRSDPALRSRHHLFR
jgi:hypothetical protein